VCKDLDPDVYLAVSTQIYIDYRLAYATCGFAAFLADANKGVVAATNVAQDCVCKPLIGFHASSNRDIGLRSMFLA